MEHCWAPLLRRSGLDIELRLERAGFAPRGEGRLLARFGGRAQPQPVPLMSFGPLEAIQVTSAVVALPAHVQRRQAARAAMGLQITGIEPVSQLVKLPGRSRGNVLAVTGFSGEDRLTTAALSARGKSAESVADEATARFRHFLKQGALVEPSLVVPLVLFLLQGNAPFSLATPWLLPRVLIARSLIELFLERRLAIEGKPGGRGVLSG